MWFIITILHHQHKNNVYGSYPVLQVKLRSFSDFELGSSSTTTTKFSLSFRRIEGATGCIYETLPVFKRSSVILYVDAENIHSIIYYYNIECNILHSNIQCNILQTTVLYTVP